MRKNIILLVCVSAAFAFSCSSDKIAEDIEKEQEEQFEELIEEEEEEIEEEATEEEGTQEEEIEEEETDLEQEDGTGENTMIHGKWEATELQVDQNAASDQVKFAKQILDHLTNKECFVISFTFNTDFTVLAENSVNYLEINIGGTGLDIPCPEKKDTESTKYSYDGETLTLIDGDGKELEVSVTVEEDTMTVDAKDLDLPNFNEEGQLIFKKRE